jgi:hypothetical protein
MGFLKRMSGWLLKPNSVPYNRLIKGHTVSSPTDFADKNYVDEAYELSNDNLTAAIMARMGFVMIPTNISLSPFPNPITVNGRNYTLVEKQRVLLIGQTTPSENGVYEVSGANLVRINDLVALDGISISTNQIALKRWANALNALRFNGSGEAQVRVRNTGTNAFGGLQVDATTGEIWIDETTLPGFAGSLTVEQALAFVGIASKMNFNDDFTLNWDGTNARLNVSMNAPKLTPVGIIEDEAISGGTPPPPAGYLLCNGATHSVASYPALFDKIGGAFITNPEINRPPNQPPILSSNTSSPPIVVSASTVRTSGTNEAWRAFDNNTSDGWMSVLWSNTSTPPTAGGEWLKIDFGTAFVFEAVYCFHGESPNVSTMANYKLQASTNDSTWVDILTNFANTTWVNTNNTNAYRYWRILCTSINSATTLATYIRKLEFRQPLYSPLQFFQVPNIGNLATNVRRIIKA